MAPALDVVRTPESPTERFVRTRCWRSRRSEAVGKTRGSTARMAFIISAHRVESLIPVISTHPGSSSKPFFGLVRFIAPSPCRDCTWSSLRLDRVHRSLPPLDAFLRVPGDAEDEAVPHVTPARYTTPCSH